MKIEKKLKNWGRDWQGYANLLMVGRLSMSNGLAYFAGMTAFRLTLGGVSWILISSLEGSIKIFMAIIFGLLFLAIGLEFLGVLLPKKAL